MSITTLRRIAAVASTAAIATLGLAAPAAAAGAGNLPSIGSFAFAQAHVDATAGNATNTMTWSVRDKASGASTIWGDLSIRQQGAQSGTYVGPTYHVTFGTSWDGTIEVLASSGDAHESSYTYALPVPAQVAAYIERATAAKGTAAWIRGALAEQEFLAFEEPYRTSRD